MLRDAIYSHFKNFFEVYKQLYNEIIDIVCKYPERRYLILDFEMIDKFNHELSLVLLDEPERVIPLCQKVVQEIARDFDPEFNEKIYISIYNLPKYKHRIPSTLRADDIGKLICIEGIIKIVYSPKDKLSVAYFQCPYCGNIIQKRVGIHEHKLTSKCYCDCKEKVFDCKFLPTKSKYIKTQFIEVQDYGTHNQNSINIMLLGEDFVNTYTAGQKVRITGILYTAERLNNNAMSAYTKTYLEAIHIELLDKSVFEKEPSKGDIEYFRKLAKREDILDILVRSLVPSIKGYEDIKTAVLLQHVRGVKKVRKDGTIWSDAIHIYKCGEPGLAKSKFLIQVAELFGGKYANGAEMTGAGLSAAVDRSQDPSGTSGWTLHAGALPLAHEKTLCLDEMDKIRDEDKAHLNEAMAQGTVTIDKVIHASLPADVCILAAANPMYRRFDMSLPLATNLGLKPDLLTRFHLVFYKLDEAVEKSDKELVEHIFAIHTGRDITKETEEILSPEMLVKYVNYARKLRPSWSREAENYIKEFFLNMRKESDSERRRFSISPRQLEAMITLAEASAKLHLREIITIKDAELAADLIKCYMATVMELTPEALPDIDRLITDTSFKQRSIVIAIRELIGNGTMDEQRLVDALKLRQFTEEEINHALKTMFMQGELQYTAEKEILDALHMIVTNLAQSEEFWWRKKSNAYSILYEYQRQTGNLELIKEIARSDDLPEDLREVFELLGI